VTDSFEVQAQRAMERIRGYLGNRGYRPHGLPRFSHASACAAADVFEDAGLAIDTFNSLPPKADIGQQYLSIYGVLQAARLQQDALRCLHDACGIGPLDLLDGMKKLREIRDRAAGHPAPTSKGNTATFLVRCFLSGGKLTLHRYLKEGGFIPETIDLYALLNNHSIDASAVLVSIANCLDRKERETQITIMNKGEVASLLPQTWSYLLGKCHEASRSLDSSQALLAKAGIPPLKNMISSVENGLSERKLPPIDDWHIDCARDGLERLDTLLEELAHGLDRKLEIAAFATLVEQHFKHISEVLHEIDNDLRANA
jgi:hypothetical protein